MNSKIFLLITLVAFINLSGKELKDDWKLVKNTNGIKAYTRVVEGSDVKQVKVTTSIKSKLSPLVYVVKNVETHKNWIYRCKKAFTIKEVNEKDYYYYNESEAPWPVSNRDIVTRAVISQDSKSKTVYITSIGVPNYIKKIKGIERIKNLEAKWVFTPKPNGYVHITFIMLIDLGGGLPSWLINLAIAEGPHDTVFKYKKEVLKPEYQKIRLNYIEEI